MTFLWNPFPHLRDSTPVNSLRLPRKSYRIGGLLFTKKGDFNALSARLWRLERIQELCVNEISMLYSCAVSYIVGFSSAMKIYPAGFLKTWLPPNRPLPSNHSQKVANIKTKNASIAVSLPFLSSSSLFPLLVWLLSLSGAENLPFGPFSLKWRANFVRFVVKKSTGNTICKRLKCWKKTLLLVRYGCMHTRKKIYQK